MSFKSAFFLCLLCILVSCKKKNLTPISTVKYHDDGDVSKLYFNNDNAVNIIVLGDGFIKEDLKVGGNFDLQAKNLIDYLFTVAPFSQHKSKFNTFVVYTESASRKATKGYHPTASKTTFKSYFDAQVDRLLMPGNSPLCYEYVAKAIPVTEADLIIMIVNDDIYGGSGGRIATVSTNYLSKYIMVHEIGHSFANLGDEYVDLAIANNYPVDAVPYLPNIDITNDHTKIKWSHIINRPSYQQIVSSYEGAYYRNNGFYRAESRSVMSDINTLSFNAPSREAIVKKIFQLTNTPFNAENFFKDDILNIQPILLSFKSDMQFPKGDFVDLKEKVLKWKEAKKIQ